MRWIRTVSDYTAPSDVSKDFVGGEGSDEMKAASRERLT